MNKAELLRLALEAGFESPESNVGLSGQSDFDEQLLVGEYPCGEAVLKLAQLLGVPVEDKS